MVLVANGGSAAIGVNCNETAAATSLRDCAAAAVAAQTERQRSVGPRVILRERRTMRVIPRERRTMRVIPRERSDRGIAFGLRQFKSRERKRCLASPRMTAESRSG